MKRLLTLILAALLLCSLFAACGEEDEGAAAALTNVSYDPTRELYEDYNTMFSEYWLEKTGEAVDVTQSHGGSGSQALSVANGLEADVVTLALEADVNSIEDAGLIEAGWLDEYENQSSPYTSTIVFVVRAGNPKGVSDWGDLAESGLGVIAPNPKTSGAARWIFLAAWAWGEDVYADDAEISAFMRALYHNVLVLDTGARGSTTTFCENAQGDVLLAWENEAYLILDEYPDEYEIVSPSKSILCQPSVAVVDEVADKNGTRELAEAYLEHLYSDEAQRLIGEHHYRPSNETILNEFSDVFDLEMELVTIEHFGSWREAQEKYFGDGGVFDQIYG